jgi:hypothetical protein
MTTTDKRKQAQPNGSIARIAAAATAAWCAVTAGARAVFWWAFHNRIAIGIASLIWLIARSGSQPRRVNYPCQRAAAANVSALAATAAASLALPHRLRRKLTVSPHAQTVIGIAIVALLAWWAFGHLFQAAVPWAIVEQQQLADEAAYPAVNLSRAIVYPSADEAVVSMARDRTADYVSESPHDPDGNPAYKLVWWSVAQLGLGSEDNPLGNFIEPGDKVFIKPNLEGSSPLQHTRPCVLRPLIDMAARAGAGEILFGDSSPCGSTDRNLDNSKYNQLVAKLNERGMRCKLSTCNLDKTPWSWVTTGPEASAYPPGEFSDDDLWINDMTSYY